MNRPKFSALLSILALSCFFVGSSSAQEGAVVEMETHRFSSGTLHEAGSGLDHSDQGKVANFFLNVPLDRLMSAAKKAGESPEIESTLYYVKDNRFRGDMTSSKMGKASIFFDTQTSMMDFVRWDLEKYASMDVNQTRKDVSKAMEGVGNIPNMDKILERLPEDERQQAIEAIERAKKSGYKIPGMENIPGMDNAEEKKVTDTGDEKTINKFHCSRYIIEQGNKTISAWVTRSKPELTRIYHRVSNEFKESFQMGPDQSEEDIDSLFPDAVPILKRTFTYSAYGDVRLEVEEIKSAEIKKITDDVLNFSKDDFQKVSIMELMGDMR